MFCVKSSLSRLRRIFFKCDELRATVANTKVEGLVFHEVSGVLVFPSCRNAALRSITLSEKELVDYCRLGFAHSIAFLLALSCQCIRAVAGSFAFAMLSEYQFRLVKLSVSYYRIPVAILSVSSNGGGLPARILNSQVRTQTRLLYVLLCRRFATFYLFLFQLPVFAKYSARSV